MAKEADVVIDDRGRLTVPSGTRKALNIEGKTALLHISIEVEETYDDD